jgi:hypothetical protein
MQVASQAFKQGAKKYKSSIAETLAAEGMWGDDPPKHRQRRRPDESREARRRDRLEGK